MLGRRKVVGRHGDREFGTAFDFLMHELRAAFRGRRELYRNEVSQTLSITAIDERVAVPIYFAAVPHVDHDMASWRKARKQTPGRVGQCKEFDRTAYVPKRGRLYCHDLTLVQPELLVGHTGELLRR